MKLMANLDRSDAKARANVFEAQCLDMDRIIALVEMMSVCKCKRSSIVKHHKA